LRGSDAISFGDAVEFSTRAYKETGIRPAFLLGILSEETNLGANLGSGNWKVDSHPTRDKPIFKIITDTLGLDPDKMPVSKKPWYGYGGAMGPAQFIPSTWVFYGGYAESSKGAGDWTYYKSKDKVRKLTGKNSPSNPWDPEDAIMAAAVLLRDNGGAKGGYNAEWLAAQRYFAGWKNAENPSYAFYGNEVMELTAKYQKQIDILSR